MPPPQEEPPPAEPPPVFQTGFSLALRFGHGLQTWWAGDTTTFRLRVPIGRAGERLRFAFRAGEAPMILHRATVARYDPTLEPGALGSEPIALTFGGEEGASVDEDQRVLSDPIDLPVAPLEEVLVSLEVEGAIARSGIGNLPGGYVKTGAWAHETGPFGSYNRFAVGLVEVAVEARGAPAMLAIGDSITEGYVGYAYDDHRQSWPFVAMKETGVTINNAGVSSAGVDDVLDHLERDVLSLSGITDCLVLIGTNDVSSETVDALIAKLQTLYRRLEPHCRVWGATLPPRERTSADGSLEQMFERRDAVNRWIREEADVTAVFDFDRVLADPADPDHFLAMPKLGEDGVHPTVEGQRRMGLEAARVLRETLGLP